MKRLDLFAAATGLLLLLAGSCTKDGAELFTGYYSFKTGGTLETRREYSDESIESDTVTLPLTSESGQLNILHEKDNKVILAFNIMGGDPVVVNGSVNADNELVLEKTTRLITVKDGALSPQFTVTISGRGKKYDDVVIFNLKYDGSASTTLRNYTIISSNVQCVAKING